MRGGHWPANLATLANGLVGVGAIVYVFVGNPLWAMLLVVSGVGFDGLDGWLSRRSGLPGTAFGRAADSVSDAATFGVAPASLVFIHTTQSSLWGPWGAACLAVAATYALLAIGRLGYFTLRGYQHKDFVGAPTPQAALGLIALLLFFDVPGFAGANPPIVLLGATAIAVAMVVPVPFPKIRRGSALRPAMTATAIALVVAVVIVQFRPPAGSPAEWLALGTSFVAGIGLLIYYVAGPFTVPRAEPGRSEGTPP
ncbi:MAG TPA: CDP-alcohol phosphatidyltransferase family protein [Thermoplasmata archaeon]|nr:CDP-alcohol phosphatidyltransferase family protein [Thermoplasmata archaeon]